MRKLKLVVLALNIFLAINAKAQWNITTWVPGGDYEALQFLNADTGFCLEVVYKKSNAYAIFYRTANQGQTWDSVFSNDTIVPKYIFDNMNWVGITATGLYRTYNSGISWQKTANIDSVFNIYFYSANLGFAYNYRNIYKSIDSGKTWKIVFNKYQSQYGFPEACIMNFFDAAHGYLIGTANSSYLLYETIDSGNTWAYKMPDAYPISETFVTPSIAYGISGGNGNALYKSIDSGKTWQKSGNGLPNFNIETFTFTDSLIGYAVCQDRNDVIYKTSDGARTWHLQQNLGVSVLDGYQNYSYIKFINKNIGYIYNTVGNVNSNIAFTTNAGGPLAPTGIQPTKKTEGFAFSIYPNPSASSFTLSASLPATSIASLTVYDIAGQQIMSLPLQPDGQGNILRQINTTNLSVGYYMVTLEQNGVRMTDKLLVE